VWPTYTLAGDIAASSIVDVNPTIAVSNKLKIGSHNHMAMVGNVNASSSAMEVTFAVCGDGVTFSIDSFVKSRLCISVISSVMMSESGGESKISSMEDITELSASAAKEEERSTEAASSSTAFNRRRRVPVVTRITLSFVFPKRRKGGE